MIDVRPVRLETRSLVLEPLSLDHSDELLETVDENTFQFYMGIMPATLSPADFRHYIGQTLAYPNTVSVVARDKASGKLVAKSSFMDIRAVHDGMEIGMTWIAAPMRGTYVNPEMKLEMMRHAFEDLGCVRVQLKTDMRNLQSRAAILKAGAKFEGTLRKHGIRPDGYVRDTAMYSVIAEEWPEVKRLLEDRVAAAGSQP